MYSLDIYTQVGLSNMQQINLIVVGIKCCESLCRVLFKYLRNQLKMQIKFI